MTFFLQNLNGNLLCSVDVETTGLDVEENDIIQVAVIPLDSDLKPSDSILPFIHELCPTRKDNIDPKAMRVNRKKLVDITISGVDPGIAADRFVEWFESLKLAHRKKIVPLACNWPFDREFIKRWLGILTFDLIFHPHYRDIQPVASFLNDVAGWRGESFSYPKVNLEYLCNTLRIERTMAHDAVDDARVTAEVYRRLIQG